MMSAVPTLISIFGFAILATSLRQYINIGFASTLKVAPLFVLIGGGLLLETRRVLGVTSLQLVVSGAVLGCLVLLIATEWRERSIKRIPLVWWTLVVSGVWLVAVNALNNPQVSDANTLGRVLPLGVWAGIALLACLGFYGKRDVAGAYVAVFGLLCASIPLFGGTWRTCDQFKCGPFGALLTGPFPSENFLARFAGAAFLCALLAGRTRHQTILVGITAALVLYGTASRTSQLAVLLALVMWWVISRSHLSLRKVTIIASAVVGTALTTGVILVYSADAAFLSNRGGIWIIGRTALGGDWVRGLGVDRWSGVYEQNFMHSEALFLLFAGGAPAVILYGALITGLMVNISPSLRPFGISYAVYLLSLGLSEVIWNPLTTDGSTAIVLPLLVLGMAGSSPDEEGTRNGSDPAIESGRLSRG